MKSCDPHFTRDDAEAYVLGLLEPARCSALEAHASVCEPCGALLQAEALLEEDLRQVAQQGLPTGLPGKLLRAGSSAPSTYASASSRVKWMSRLFIVLVLECGAQLLAHLAQNLAHALGGEADSLGHLCVR